MTERTKDAIELLRAKEPKEGYYLAFSGGKDSQIIYKLAQMAGVKFDAHYNLTTVDPPELVYFIREHYPEVDTVYPKKTMWELIPERRMPPTRKVRYCCSELKENGGEGRIVITGIRAAESAKRAKRAIFEQCFRKPGKYYLNIIINWSDAEVWNFIRKEIGYWCNLYDDGFTNRIGCILCPMSRRRAREREREQFPKYVQAYIRAFDKMIKVRLERGMKTQWKTGEEVFEWWQENKESKSQCLMFD